jgi:hypothetical protein
VKRMLKQKELEKTQISTEDSNTLNK